MPETLPELLSRRASDSVALIDRGREITVADLDTESRRIARALVDLGIEEGDRVALWLPNVPAWLALLFACSHIGAIALAVNTRFRAGELEDILARSAAKVLVFWPGFRGIDFAGILNDIDPAALASLRAIVAYTEKDDTPA